MLSAIHGANAVLIAAVAQRLTNERLTALLSGAFWGLYPASILSASFFVTEGPTCLILLLSLYAASRLSVSRFWQVAAGILAGVLVVSKPALVPAAVLLLSWLCYCNKSRSFAWLTILAACIMTVLPWLLLTEASSGKLALTVQRAPMLNVASGWDLETDGLGSMPRTETFSIFSETDSPLAGLIHVWTSHPQESLVLALRKIPRLVAYPWNDFKHTVLGLDLNMQCALQTLLLCLGLCGAYYSISTSRLTVRDQYLMTVGSLLIILAGHFSYLLVESHPRYGFTAMPFMTILAATAIAAALRSGKLNATQRKLLLVSVALAITSAAILLNLERTSPLHNAETEHHFKPGDVVEKHILLKPKQHPSGRISTLLLVDADGGAEASTITVNGVQTDKLVLIHHIDAAHYLSLNALQEYRNGLGTQLDDFRQWRFVTVPNSAINWNGDNVIQLTQRAPATIYGDTHGRIVPSTDRISYNQMCALPLHAPYETRPPASIEASGSAEKSLVSSSGGLKTRFQDALRVRLTVLPDAPIENLPLSGGNTTACRIAIEPERFPLLMQGKDESGQPCIRISRPILKSSNTTAANIPLPLLANTTHISIRVHGICRAVGKTGKIGIAVALHGKDGRSQLLGNLPVFIKTARDWTSFQIDDLVPTQTLIGNPSSVELVVYPCPWMQAQYNVREAASSALIKNLSLDLQTKDLPRLSPGRALIL